jgi:hypothetical protein
MAGTSTREPHPSRLRELESDLRTRVPRPDDEHGPVRELERITVAARMDLVDFGGKPPTDCRNSLLLERARCDHDLIGLVNPVAGVDDEAQAIVPDGVDPRVETHRQVEPLGVSR